MEVVAALPLAAVVELRFLNDFFFFYFFLGFFKFHFLVSEIHKNIRAIAVPQLHLLLLPLQEALESIPPIGRRGLLWYTGI